VGRVCNAYVDGLKKVHSNYRAMLAQSAVMRLHHDRRTDDMQIACRLSVCLSVCLSVTTRYRDHIGWNSSKIISRPNSSWPMRSPTPTWAIWCNGNTQKLGWNRGELDLTIEAICGWI